MEPLKPVSDASAPRRRYISLFTPVKMILVNGIEADRISVGDRGLHYGDGLFETIAVADGAPIRWRRHLDRLADGCRRLGIPMPNAEDLEREAMHVCARAEKAVLKITVTRGSGGRGYKPPQNPVPTRIVALHPWPQYPALFANRGVKARICTTRLGANPQLAGIKHLNRLEQVLARREWDDPEIPEGLMLDGSGRVIEGTMSNLFLVRGGCVFTPELSESGVAGIVRGLVLESCRALDIPLKISDIKLHDVQQADELFLTNSIIGLWPVIELEGRRYEAGPVARRLAAAIATIRA